MELFDHLIAAIHEAEAAPEPTRQSTEERSAAIVRTGGVSIPTHTHRDRVGVQLHRSPIQSDVLTPESRRDADHRTKASSMTTPPKTTFRSGAKPLPPLSQSTYLPDDSRLFTFGLVA